MRHLPVILVVGATALTVAGPDLGARNVPPDADTDGPDLAVAWNALAVEIAYAEDRFFTFKGHRALAMMHLTIHDVLNAIEPVYTRYVCEVDGEGADGVAAAAQGAFVVLVSQYPDRRPALEAERDRWLDTVAQGEAKQAGVALGRTCAERMLALRKGDAWDEPGAFDFRDEVGRYQTSGTWEEFVLQPGFRYARPFAIETADRFRPPPPPALDSPAYAAAYEEVEAYGRAESAVRSDDQTAYAVWWMEFAESAVNRLGRELADAHRLNLREANRMFAHLNVALYDVYIAVWDSKYEYAHWRPITAIRDADRDGNPVTEPTSGWEPLRPTPPFPDYVSAHAAACAASLGVLAHTFGGDLPFTMTTHTAPPGMPTRSFDRFGEAAEECADSRIRLGWHFRYAADEGLTLGRRVTAYVVAHLLRPAEGGALR